ncbi:hypothetical protein ABZV75_09955 [Streptomyces flaveolus]
MADASARARARAGGHPAADALTTTTEVENFRGAETADDGIVETD